MASLFQNLPAEILFQIFSQVNSTELYYLSTMCKHFKEVCLLTNEFSFYKDYGLSNSVFMSFVDDFRNSITHLNINHCYWLTPTSVVAAISLPNLKELHIIGCPFDTLAHYKQIPFGLTALSISFVPDRPNVDNPLEWVSLFSKSPNYLEGVFSRLKQLTIYILNPPTNKVIGIQMFYWAILHCRDLEVLKVSGDRSGFDYYDGLCKHMATFESGPYLQNLKELYLDFEEYLPDDNNVNLQNIVYKYILKYVKKLKFARFGCLSWHLLENYHGDGTISHYEKKFINLVSAEDTTEISLDCDIHGRTKLIRANPLIWENRLTPGCKSMSFQNLSFECMEITSFHIATSGPNLQRLILRNCEFQSSSDLLDGLAIIAKNCKNLNYLDLVIGEIHKNRKRDYCQILLMILRFERLKVLHLNSSLVTTCNFATNRLYDITEICNKIEEFQLISRQSSLSGKISAGALSWISNWKHLKKLVLFDIFPYGKKHWFKKIITNCQNLEVIKLILISCNGYCVKSRDYILKGLSYATNLREFSFQHDCPENIFYMNLDDLVKSLKNCKNLEKLYVSHLAYRSHSALVNFSRNIEEKFIKNRRFRKRFRRCFQKLFTTFPKLILFGQYDDLCEHSLKRSGRFIDGCHFYMYSLPKMRESVAIENGPDPNDLIRTLIHRDMLLHIYTRT
ncbi:hypothetical protein CHUAL_006700 [Chamberlinius hualienensis]